MQTSIFCFVPEISILLKPKTFYCHCQTQSSQNSPWRELGRVAWLILLLSKPAAWWQYGCLRLDIFSLVLLFFLPAKLAFFQTAGRLVQRCLGLSSLTALSHAAATFALSLAESRRPMHCKLRGCFFCIICLYSFTEKAQIRRIAYQITTSSSRETSMQRDWTVKNTAHSILFPSETDTQIFLTIPVLLGVTYVSPLPQQHRVLLFWTELTT